METQSARIEIRLKPSDKAFIERAAELEGLRMADFLRTHLLADANLVHQRYADESQSTVSEQFFQELLDALDAPPEPNELAIRGVERLNELLSE